MPFRPLIAVVSVTALAITGCTGGSGTAPDTGTTAPAQPASTRAAASPDPRPPMATPVVARVVAAPIPVNATDGKTHLAYELQLTNMLPSDVTLTSVDVRDGGRSLLNLPADRLAYWTRVVGTQTPVTKLGPAQAAIVWLDVVIPAGEAVPDRLEHNVGVAVAQPKPPLLPATLTEEVAPVTVQTRKPVVVSPPLAGRDWLDANSCCDMTPHRTAVNPIDGDLWAAERFAIDYVQLQPDGRLFHGDVSDVRSYPYFGTDILAAGDGPVIAAVDGLPEEVPGKTPTGLSLDQYGGNHVVQDLGGGNYAFYAHMMTGSVKVKPGDRLTTGQVIGSVGNSGNSDAPHLHFHIMSTPDPLRSDGLPFVFSTFRLDSRLTGSPDDLFSGKPATLQPGFAARTENDTSPLVYDVMTYADR